LYVNEEKISKKGNTMAKKTIVFLVGGVVLAFVAVAVYAATTTSQTLTNGTSVTNAEVTNVEACGQYCGKDCNGDCESCDNCDGNCQNCDNWDNCDRPCKGRSEGQGHEFGKCGGGGCRGRGI